MTEDSDTRRTAFGPLVPALAVACVVALGILAFSLGSALADDGSSGAAAAAQSAPSYQPAQDQADPPARADDDCPFGGHGHGGGDGGGGSSSGSGAGTAPSVNY
jgi:hypothetical protein